MALRFQLQLQSTYNATSTKKSSSSSFYQTGRKLSVSDSIPKKGRPLPLPLLWQRGPASIVSVHAVSRNDSSDAKKGGGGLPNSNYVVPLDKSFSAANSSCITRPLAEILRDLNKRIPDNIIKTSPSQPPFIPWYHANRMLSFYAPGWCGEVRDVIYSDNGSVTVVYRVTITGSDGEAYRESSGTICWRDKQIMDPAAAAEEIAFCRACARFGLGLYLYHEE